MKTAAIPTGLPLNGVTTISATNYYLRAGTASPRIPCRPRGVEDAQRRAGVEYGEARHRRDGLGPRRRLLRRRRRDILCPGVTRLPEQDEIPTLTYLTLALIVLSRDSPLR